MVYRVAGIERFARELARVPRKDATRIRNAVDTLADDPRPPGAKRLTTGDYRIRVGDYRIVYAIDDGARVVTVVGVGHRRDVYR